MVFSHQEVLVFLAAKSGFIRDAEEAAQFQDFIICVEMLVAAVGHLYAFPYKEYAGANIGGSCGLTGSLGHALKLNDFYHDTVHSSHQLIMIMCSTTIMMEMKEQEGIEPVPLCLLARRWMLLEETDMYLETRWMKFSSLVTLLLFQALPIILSQCLVLHILT